MKLGQPLARILNVRNWPWMASAILVLLTVVLQLVAYGLAQKTNALDQMLTAAVPTRSEPPDIQADMAASLPDHASYTQNLASFFKIASASGIELGAIDYRVEDNPKLPFLVYRSIEFRLNDEYPKVKAFLSRVLQKLPHASLQEIRIEKKDVLTAQGAVQVKLTLLYRVTPPALGGTNGK
jgi:hypothetical protein